MGHTFSYHEYFGVSAPVRPVVVVVIILIMVTIANSRGALML